ncbi:MAG: O-methyltransferase [Firmicutes bacterium]|nr:O-methyltransferase [Bacillota bacterium]MBQ2305084.1 O-methyltransferase [Bacillota bacterium]
MKTMNDGNVMRHVTKDITNEAVTEYLTSFYRPLSSELGEFRIQCEEEPVPIILRETEDFLSTFMDVIKPGNVLEIGTAAGYSAMFFAEKIRSFSDPHQPVVFTVEKDEEMHLGALREIERLDYSPYIRCYLGDCEEGISKIREDDPSVKFDMVFIDAAKSHYKRFLDASLKVLSEEGIIICDDTLFQGRPALEDELPPRKHRTNTLALREFNSAVKNDPGLSSTLIAVGNGLTIIKPIK